MFHFLEEGKKKIKIKRVIDKKNYFNSNKNKIIIFFIPLADKYLFFLPH